MFDFDGEDKCVNITPLLEKSVCAAIFYNIFQFNIILLFVDANFHSTRIVFTFYTNKYKEEKEEKVKLKSAKVDRT